MTCPKLQGKELQNHNKTRFSEILSSLMLTSIHNIVEDQALCYLSPFLNETGPFWDVWTTHYTHVKGHL